NEDLMELFAQVGTVEKAVVVTDKFSGQSRGFGFVEMADQDSATKAIETLNETDLQGRRIKIDQARDGGRPGGGGGGGFGNRDRDRGGPAGGGGRGGNRWYIGKRISRVQKSSGADILHRCS